MADAPDAPDEAEAKEEKEGFPIMNWIGFAILLGAYATAVIHMLGAGTDEKETGVPVVRILHWQLEGGVREAFDELANNYERMYKENVPKARALLAKLKAEGLPEEAIREKMAAPDPALDGPTRSHVTMLLDHGSLPDEIDIKQLPITERAYRQYVTTQCIGGTAPDLIQFGNKLDMRFMSRYFLSIAKQLQQPNPYNAGSKLDGTPWIDTFNDGLNSALDQDAAEYFGVGLSAFTVRLFYNMDLMEKATGSDEPPQTFREFIEACQKMRAWAEREEREEFVPIAAADYQVQQFMGNYRGAVTLRFSFEQDWDYNAFADATETTFGYLRGDYDFKDDDTIAMLKMTNDVAQHFPKGFMSMKRQESSFLFTQEKAAFILTGSWEAMSLMGQSEFRIGVMNLPIPTRQHPQYGEVVSGRVKEELGTGFLLGLVHFYSDKKRSMVFDFLHYATTKENNEQFNRTCRWIPVIKGAHPRKELMGFMPEREGYWGSNPWGFGKATLSRVNNFLPGYLENRKGIDTFFQELEAALPEALAEDIEKTRRSQAERDLQNRVRTARFFTSAVFDPEASVRERSTEKLGYFWERRMGDFLKYNRLLHGWEEVQRTENPVGKKRVRRVLDAMNK